VTAPALRFERVTKIHHRGAEEVRALVDADLTVDPGDFVVVTGPSGAGKSTLLQLAGGLDRPDAGRVSVGDVDLESLSNSQLAAWRRRSVGFVFQFFNLVPHLSATENVSLPLLLDGVGRVEADRRARVLLDELGLGDRLDHDPGELSGGQMQRVALARAVVARPALLLADEPTGNLDSASGAEVVELLRRTNVDLGCTVIVVTHDAALSGPGDRHIRMEDGRARTVAGGAADTPTLVGSVAPS
jgi:ABC-type lipoprotein export system ATPase subunit